MPFVPINLLLDKPLGPGDSLNIPYPSGKNEGSFFSGINHSLGVEGSFFRSPKDFLITTRPDRIQFTWRGKAMLRQGALLNLQLEEPGGDFYFDQRYGVTVQNMVASPVFLINFGAPRVQDLEHYSGKVAPGQPIALKEMRADVPRTVLVTSSGDESRVIFRIEGEDMYGRPVVEEIEGPNAGSVESKKAFAQIMKVAVNGATSGEVSIGIGRGLGFPVFIPAQGCVLKVMVDGLRITGGLVLSGFREPPTAATPDTKGLYYPPEEAGLDGVKALHVLVSLPNPGNIGFPEYDG